jgi:hypothetical protein
MGALPVLARDLGLSPSPRNSTLSSCVIGISSARVVSSLGGQRHLYRWLAREPSEDHYGRPRVRAKSSRGDLRSRLLFGRWFSQRLTGESRVIVRGQSVDGRDGRREGIFVSSLRERLGGGEKRRQVIDDACEVLELEVKDKSGLTGLAVKGAYAVVKGVRPGFVRQAVDPLLDDFLDALDPFVEESLAKNQDSSSFVRQNASRVANALLAITDRKAQRAESAMVRKTYEKLRPTAEKHVEAAAPRLGALLEKHAGPS